MRLLCDVTIAGLPPSKNRRTRFNRATGTIHTSEEVRDWMDTTAFMVRKARVRAWTWGRPIHMTVCLYARTLYKWDLDGALPCLVDAVMAGLSDGTKRPPDQWIVHIDAGKERAEAPCVHVVVEEEA